MLPLAVEPWAEATWMSAERERQALIETYDDAQIWRNLDLRDRAESTTALLRTAPCLMFKHPSLAVFAKRLKSLPSVERIDRVIPIDTSVHRFTLYV